MEALTRLVSDSLTRHGLNRPLDPRRLQWSRWFRCDSPHSLLVVPSKPGIFALAEEIAANVARAPSPAPPLAGDLLNKTAADDLGLGGRTLGAALHRGDNGAADVLSKRMLAVLQFSEDDDMAFVLDRMFTYTNPMRVRLHSGSCFVRFVVLEDQQQRRTICAALNQWMRSSAERASGLPADFSSSLEMPAIFSRTADEARGMDAARVPRTFVSVEPGDTQTPVPAMQPGQEAEPASAYLNSEASKNLHCPQPFPSGF